MRRRIFAVSTLFLATALILSLGFSAHGAANCQLSNGGCRATVTTSIYTGPPPYPLCPVGPPLVQVQVGIRCKGGTGSTAQIRCGAGNDPVYLSVAGRTHYIAPDSGNDWQDTLADCGALIYKVD